MRRREGEKNSKWRKGQQEVFTSFLCFADPHACRIVLCIVNGQIAATLSHKCTIRGKRRIRHILNYLALQQYDSPHSRNPVSRFANVRTVRTVIPVFVSFLFCVCHEPSPVIAPSLHTHERLRQHQGITRCDTSRN